MSINDTFIVIPLFPILVLFYFVMRDQHVAGPLLALIMACLGWAYDARLIRSVALSLRTREFTADQHLLRHEHAPDPDARSTCPTCCRSCSRPP